jgi:hypothetical protein
MATHTPRVRANSVSQAIFTEGKFEAIFPGWGGSRVVALNCSAEGNLKVIADTAPATALFTESDGKTKTESKPEHSVGLTPAFSISIAGCDLLGSCLYTAGVCTSASGKVKYQRYIHSRQRLTAYLNFLM